jgi:MoxR-like ATPase
LDFEEEFDECGLRRMKEEKVFRQTHGAIRRYLVKEEDLSSVQKEARVPAIIAITNVDAIPKNEMVKLNELVATRRIILKDEGGRLSRYVLPDWVTVTPITSDIDSLTSPFANRFKKIGLESISSLDEIWKVLSSEFPNLTKEEADFTLSAVTEVVTLCDKEAFELANDDFTLREMDELALRIQMYKQSDHEKGAMKEDPFWYAVKAVNCVILKGMCPQDREVFIKRGLEPIISSRLPGLTEWQITRYLRDLLKRTSSEDRVVERRVYEHRIPSKEFLNKVRYLPNRMAVHMLGDTLTVITDAQAYRVSWDYLGKKKSEEVLSKEGLSVKREGDTLLLLVKLLKGAGVSRFSSSEENLKRSLPPEEMSIDEFMYPADSLVDSFNALLQAHTPVRTATGRLILPRVVLMAGETGSGKTTIPKMLSRAEGTPLARVNPWRKMHGAKLTSSFSMGETIQLRISDFLKACGKVNGQRLKTASPSSDRMRILIDEANVTRSVWYLLDAIARGERRFMVETPSGEPIEIELDTETEIVLTYNPPERYGGTGKGSNRYKFPKPLTRKAVKIYTSEPIKEYEEHEKHEIMKEVYRRGENYFKRKEILRKIGLDESTEADAGRGFYAAGAEIFEVERVDEPAAVSAEELARNIAERFPKTPEAPEEVKMAKAKAQANMVIKRVIFTPEDLEEMIAKYEAEGARYSAQNRFIIFMATVFPRALDGMALEKITEELTERTIALAAELDPGLAKIMGDFSDICGQDKIDYKRVAIFKARLDRLSRNHKVYLEGLLSEQARYKGRPIVIYMALPIERTISFKEGLVKRVIGEEEFNRLFGDRQPEILVVTRPPDGTLAYYDGRDLVCAFLDDIDKDTE